jgi:hypothetical protein
MPVTKLERRVQPYRRGKAGSGSARGSAEWVRIPTSTVRPRKFTTAQLTFNTHYHVQISSLARVGQGQQLILLSWASWVSRDKVTELLARLRFIIFDERFSSGNRHNLWLNLSQDSFVVGTVCAQRLSRSRCLATVCNGAG